MKKVLALLLAAMMLIGLVACSKKGGEGTEGTAAGQSEETKALGFEDPGNYTLMAAMETTPSRVNPFTWESATDGEILGYLGSSLIDGDFDKEHPDHGYVLAAYMAKEDPKDVTAEFAGKPEYNVPKDAQEGYAFRVELVDNAAWDDGTPITADDFLFSVEAELNPKMQNGRAADLYSSTFVIAHAEEFIKQGSKMTVGIEKFAKMNGYENLDAFLKEHGEDQAKVNWANSFGEMYDAASQTWSKDNLPEEPVEAGLTINQMKDIFVTKGLELGQTEEQALQFYREETLVDYEYPAIDFSKVGIKKDGDHTFTLILDKPLSKFEKIQALGSKLNLVKKDVWEKCIEENKETGALTSTYGTKLENSPSYGPYKLKTWQDDKLIELVRNDNWFGYHDERFKGKFQTDQIRYTIVKEYATRLQMFLKGQLDAMPLNVTTVDQYRGSDYIHFTPSSFTESLNITADLKSLEARQQPGINKTILSIPEFRKALTLSIDRADYAKSTTAASTPGFGLLNRYYVTETDNMSVYRDTEIAKQTLVDVYGMEYGSGKKYATLDDAYNAMTGFDMDQAKKLFDSAYDQAVEKGLMQPSDKVVMTMLTVNDSENTRKNYNYLKEHWAKAVEGTKLEGKLDVEFDATNGEGAYNAMQEGKGDLMTAGWMGEVFNPYFLLADAYLKQNLSKGLNADKKIEIEVDGEKKAMTLTEWATAVNGGDPEHLYGSNQTSLDNRVKILAAIEKGILEQYVVTPLTYGAAAQLRSQRVQWLTYDYNMLLGYGSDTQYRTYTHTDEEWEKYVKEQGGELSYK